MNVSEAIETRRSIKFFDPNHRITDNEIQQLLNAAILAPSAFNIQHWRFVHVTDPALRRELRAIAYNQPQVTDASLLLVLCMDLMARDKSPERYWQTASPERQAQVAQTIRQFYQENSSLQRDEAMRSVAMAAMTLTLKARDMGYDSCCMDGFDYDAAAQRIRLPDDHAICMILAIGKQSSNPFPKTGRLPLEDVVFTNTF